MAPRIILDNKTLLAQYDELSPGDCVIGRIRLRPQEEHILLDLESRKIILIPSGLSQVCSRSKVFQTKLLHQFMMPYTRAVYDLHDLREVITLYGREKVEQVVCKLDRANGGKGILLFQSIEDIYNQAVLGTLQFPFVLQPYLDKCIDIRVVMLGRITEAYRRHNPDNFRHNLHCGGKGTPYKLTGEQITLCRDIMKRADFPYAHIDLLITPSKESWLTEINLRGGLRGAAISQKDYLEQTALVHEQEFQRKLKK